MKRFYKKSLAEEIAQTGSIKYFNGIPDKLKRIFITAHDIARTWHIRIQAAFQKHVDNAVSKTVNLPEPATSEDIAEIYRQAWRLGLKGVTVYRYGSKGQQVLNLGAATAPLDLEHFARCDPHACRL